MNRRQKEKQYLYPGKRFLKEYRRYHGSHKRWEHIVAHLGYMAALEGLQWTVRKEPEPPTT